MVKITEDITSWDCIEEYETHRTYVSEVNGHNLRCELQLQDTSLWGQLYDVSDSEVISEGIFSQSTEWDTKEINAWLTEALNTYFE